MTAPALLRGVLLLLLAAALVVPERSDGEENGRVIRLESEVESLLEQRLEADGADLLVRDAAGAPGAAELALLESVARKAPLLAALPEGMPPLRVERPSGLRAGRRGALRVSVRGSPGDTVPLYLEESGTVVDSVRVGVGGDGEGSAGFRLRPTSAGWREWRVAGAGAAVEVGAWVEEDAAPHIFLHAGAPGWESRFLARSLEESGATVALSHAVGPDVQIGDPMPSSLEGLERYDVVIVLPGAPLAPERVALLERFVSESGGGLLLAGNTEGIGTFGIADAAARGSVDGAGVRWSAPPELEALPRATLETAALSLERTRPGLVTIATDAGGATVAAIRALGFGRVAFVGLTESWRWRLEAGSVAQHRDFWRALVDWLAASEAGRPSVRPHTDLGELGVPVPVDIYRGTDEEDAEEGRTMRTLQLIRPDGVTEALPVQPVAGRPGHARATFLPTTVGVYRLVLEEDGGAHAGFLARSAANASEAEVVESGAGARWAELAYLADRSGGALIDQESLERRVESALAMSGEPGPTLPVSRSILLALAVIVAIAEWTLRRVRGLA